MARTAPTRIDADLYSFAAATGKVMSRSTAQQIVHWARLGRAVESARLTQPVVAAVLERQASYDQLDDPFEQAAVRAAWEQRIADARAGLNLAKDFAEQRRSYVELDDDGNVVERHPTDPAAR